MSFKAKGMLFYDLGTVGWSEVYWLSSADFGAARVDLDAINTARCGMMSPDVGVPAGVIYNVGDPRTRASDIFGPTVVNGTFVTGGSVSLDPNIAVRARFFDAAFRSAAKWMRAIPQSVMTPPDTYTVVAAWETAFAAWSTAALGKVQLRHVDRSVIPPIITYANVTDIRNEKVIAYRKSGRPFESRRGRRLTA